MACGCDSVQASKLISVNEATFGEVQALVCIHQDKAWTSPTDNAAKHRI